MSTTAEIDPKLMRELGRDLVASANHEKEQIFAVGARMCALAGNVWPQADGGLLRIVSDELLASVMQFSVHARRLMEMLKYGKGSIQCDGPLFRVTHEQYPLENDVWTIVNRVLHSQELKVISFKVGKEKYAMLGDEVVVRVLIMSEKRSGISICPQGMFFGFARDWSKAKEKSTGNALSKSSD